jgi:uncharacterized protein (TIGR03437 family)
MRCPRRFIVSFFVFTAGGVSIFAQPSVLALANNYSGTKPGLPNYGISPGSLFVIFGSDLATTINTAETFPLTTNLNGTSVSVTVNGTTTQPTLYYILPTQIAAVLPEDTPLGTGTLTVTSPAGTSQSVPIEVVQSDFGILTENGAGFGPAAGFDTDYNPITAIHPANPGQLIVFWGTGVGADPENDDKTEPQKTNNLTSIPMRVYIGGISATVYYKGRSAYPGVDELIVYVPSDVLMGCYVSVVTLSGTVTSNYATIPVAPQDATSCNDQITIFNDWRTLAGKSSANIATLKIDSSTTESATGTQTSSEAQAQFKTDNTIEIYSELFSDGLLSVGNCIVDQGNSAGVPTIISAGSSLTVSGPGSEQTTMSYSAGQNPAYSMTLPNTFIPSAGGTFTMGGSGGPGAQIGSFTVSVTLPPAITWTNMSAASNIIGSQGFTMTWTGGTTDGLVLISGDSTGTAGVKVKFECIASASDGTFTIPPEVLLSLPDTTTSGKLGIANLENPVTFSASGLDLGFLYGGFSWATQLAHYQANASSGPQLESLSLSVSQGTSGSMIQGTVVLSSAAPSAGVTVDLSSSNSSAASVPASVTVPAGSTSANFTITLGTVSSAQMVTITAMYGSNSSEAMLTVNPQATGLASFNGTYTGGYSGTLEGKMTNGSVTAVVDNGTISVTKPGSGTGTVSATGQITFGVDVTSGVSCNFTGSIVLMGTEATASGTYSCPSVNGMGTWNLMRQ